jgi:hypothetical protein
VRGLAEQELLPLWEATAAGALAHADALLAAARPELAAEERRTLTIGQRDAALLELYALTFGARLEGFVRCPECDEPLELELGGEQLRAILAGDPALGEHEMSFAGGRLRFRPLTCGDLEAVTAVRDRDEARRRLAERCVIESTGELGEDVLAGLAERLEACDPQADVGVRVGCPECGTEWRALLDMAAFLGAAIDAEAPRLLEQVHVLARSYGWSEAEVLALSPRRRELYLDLAG